MISYEGASQDSVDCYLAEKLAPLQPVILWGRTANIDPVVDKSHGFPIDKEGSVLLPSPTQSGCRPLELRLVFDHFTAYWTHVVRV